MFTKEMIEIVKEKFSGFGIDMDKIKTRLEEIYSKPFMNQFTDENERQMCSVRILMAQVIAENDKKSFSKNETVIVRVEGKDEIKAFKRQNGDESYISNLYVVSEIDNEFKFGTLTLWGDANETHPKFVIGNTYEIEATVGTTVPLTMSMNDPCDIQSVDKIEVPLNEVIRNTYTPIEISEMEFNVSKDRNDAKVVNGTVLSVWQKVTKNDTNMGFMKIMGSSEEEITVVKFSGNSDQVMIYGAGSMVMILGQITPATTDYDVGMWGNLVIPILQIPVESEVEENTPTESTSGFSEDDVSGW